MEAGFQGATHAGNEEREGEVRSSDSWSEITARQPEGAAAHLRDLQPEERRGDLVFIFHHPIYVPVGWRRINQQNEISFSL